MARQRPPALARRRTLSALAFLAVLLGLTAPCSALLPTSPRVKTLLEAGIKTLETLPYSQGYETKLGSKCLVGLALYKAGHKDSPRIKEAIEACVTEFEETSRVDTTYSLGLAVIFLSEVAPQQHRSTIQQYLGVLSRRQHGHGGWGYVGEEVGDTSQTQYVALAMWQAHRAGLKIEGSQAKGLIDWLNRTQAPDGGWGYKGVVATGSDRIEQTQITPTLTAAGLASLMIGADLHGVLSTGALAVADDGVEEVSESVRQARELVSSPAGAISPAGVDWGRVAESLKMGDSWMDALPKVDPTRYPYYYLYALERYHSFREARVGDAELEPKWYEQGIDYLESHQLSAGVWDGSCGRHADTAFSVMFMLRATQRSLQHGIGEGALVSGRGLPKNLASATLRRGQVIVEMDEVGVGDFLAMMEKGEADRLDALAADPSALVVGDLSSADAERLAQVMRTGKPEMRRLAAKALGRDGALDNTPALLYGLTDPDRFVALASRDGLRAIARRPRGFGMPDDFTDDQRYQELDQWKRWYLTLRPEAILDLGR